MSNSGSVLAHVLAALGNSQGTHTWSGGPALRLGLRRRGRRSPYGLGGGVERGGCSGNARIELFLLESLEKMVADLVAFLVWKGRLGGRLVLPWPSRAGGSYRAWDGGRDIRARDITASAAAPAGVTFGRGVSEGFREASRGRRSASRNWM